MADTGIGMNAHDRDRLFERGYRSDAARASGIPGAGIGMAVVGEIIEQHAGSLNVESAIGRGASHRWVPTSRANA
ncbi:ATP-binding protein [Microbacterium aurum]|uniref:ATP-binding protein n=1 Tax=Microbacterium aurum TaxID=36805 RepID=UPI0018DCA39E|nr:ATP-binding protein [Microbacterium aurum]MBM7829222.1 signal transduction histidine kinase [Microbacterium aurum]